MSKLRVTKSFLDELAERDGLLTLDALRSAGISRSVQARLVRDGLLSDLTAGHFVAGDADWTSYAAAGLRIGGEQSALAGGSSLACDGFGERQLPICVLVPRTVQPRDRDWLRFWRSDTGNRRVLGHLTPRRVAFDDSVIDACRDLDELGAVALVTRVIQERRTTASRRRRVPRSAGADSPRRRSLSRRCDRSSPRQPARGTAVSIDSLGMGRLLDDAVCQRELDRGCRSFQTLLTDRSSVARVTE